VKFPLSLRVPAWCSSPQLKVNGTVVAVQSTKGFVTITREFQPGDTVVLTLPMRLAVSRWPQNGIAVEHGPLVYSLPIQETWTSVVEPRFTTASFPSWNATPASSWNYGLLLDERPLEQQILVERSAASDVPDDPWSHPPVHITVSARKVEGYELQAHTNKSGQQFTPPLPDIATSTLDPQVERISLAPCGATQLRVTIFPDITRGLA
jgi:hypothetical protein